MRPIQTATASLSMPCSVIYHYILSLSLCFAINQTQKFFVLLSDQTLGCPAKPHFIPECNQSGVSFLYAAFLSLCGWSLQCNHVTSSLPSLGRMCKTVFYCLTCFMLNSSVCFVLFHPVLCSEVLLSVCTTWLTSWRSSTDRLHTGKDPASSGWLSRAGSHTHDRELWVTHIHVLPSVTLFRTPLHICDLHSLVEKANKL